MADSLRSSLAAALGLAALLVAGPARAQGPAVTLWGDFDADENIDRLDIYGGGGGWWVTLGGQPNPSNWLPGWGPGSRNHLGDFDGDGRDDVLIFVPGQGWHLLLSTGSQFSPRLDVNPGFGAGYRECATSYDGDPASELIMEADTGTCWQYETALSRFTWTTCTRLCNAPRPFFFVEDGQLYADDGLAPEAYAVRGVSYLGCRGVEQYATVDGLGRERATWALFFMRDCGPHMIRADFLELRDRLGVNTVRILTPARKTEYPNPWEDWYNPDGTVSEAAKAKLGELFTVARDLGMNLSLVLQLHFLRFDEAPPGSAEEAFWLNYMTSLGAALRNEPALFSYEVASEALLRCVQNGPCNYWQQDGFEAKALSYYTRMARALRAADGNHLITSGQVVTLDRYPYNTAWHYPSPEFAVLPDVDNLNGGQPFSLYSQLDYLAPHAYAMQPPLGPIAVLPEEVVSALRDVKARLDQQPVQKAYTLAEVGYGYDPLALAGTPGAPTANELEQARYFTLVTEELVKAGSQGMIVWDASPQVATLPGSYDKYVDNPYWLVTIRLHSPPHPRPRQIVVLGAEMWNLFYWDFADRPAAVPIRNFFSLR